MTNYGTYGLSSHTSDQSGREPSSQGYGHWFGSTTSRPRCYEPCSYGASGGYGGYGGHGSCGGHGGYGRMGCQSGFGGGLGAPYGGYGGRGGCGSWCNPGSNSSSKWGSGWGN